MLAWISVAPSVLSYPSHDHITHLIPIPPSKAIHSSHHLFSLYTTMHHVIPLPFFFNLPYTHGCSSPYISRPMHAPMANLCYMNSWPSNPLLSYLYYPHFLPSLSTRGRTSSMTSRALHVHIHPSFSILPTCCPFSHMHEALQSYQIAEEATNTVKSTAKSAPSRVIRGGSLITKKLT